MLTAQRFPGGIADAQGQRAALRDAGGRLCAIALDAGALLWRSAEPLAPLLLPPGEVIACTLDAAPVCVALAWSGAQAGEPVWSSQPLGLPARPDPALQLDAAADDHGTLTVRWQGAALWRGGAAPGPAQRAAARAGIEGAVNVDRRTGHVAPVPGTFSAAADGAAEAPAPDALGAVDIGSTHFELQLREPTAGRVQTVLQAREREGDRLLWELTIDDVPRTPPRPLRA